jgi:hypothetical protein
MVPEGSGSGKILGYSGFQVEWEMTSQALGNFSGRLFRIMFGLAIVFHGESFKAINHEAAHLIEYSDNGSLDHLEGRFILPLWHTSFCF